MAMRLGGCGIDYTGAPEAIASGAINEYRPLTAS